MIRYFIFTAICSLVLAGDYNAGGGAPPMPGKDGAGTPPPMPAKDGGGNG